MQVERIKPRLKAPGTERLKVNHDEPPSNDGFKFSLRRYDEETPSHFQKKAPAAQGGWGMGGGGGGRVATSGLHSSTSELT